MVSGPVRGGKSETIEDKTGFITFAMRSVKHSTVHRTRIAKKKRKMKAKSQEYWASSDKSIHTRETDSSTVWRQQCCWKNGSMVIMLLDKNTEGELPRVTKPCTRGGRERSHFLSRRSATMWNTSSVNTIRKLTTGSRRTENYC